MGENSFTEVPETIHQMNETELSSRVASMQKRIEQGIASDEDYLEDTKLEYVIQELDRFPGLGDTLLATALQSAYPRTRIAAAKVLIAWGKDHMSDELKTILKSAYAIEPDPELKEYLGSITQ